MENSRGKKGKKASWHLTLGLKDTIFAGIGLVGLMMISFALGVLSGRGDIYRVAYSWGLLASDGSKIAQQWSPPGVAPTAMPQGALTAPGAAPVAAAPPTPASAPAPLAGAAKQPGAAPVTGSIAAAPASSPSAKKKSKSGSSSGDHKAREEEMHKLRQEVAGKLKFQNSFDTAPKPSKLSSKQKSKEKEAKAKTAAAPAQVRVAQFRDAKSAKAKMAELQKKGIKATLKQGKDSKGTFYTVYRQSAANSPTSENLAQKPEKGSDSKRKPDSQ